MKPKNQGLVGLLVTLAVALAILFSVSGNFDRSENSENSKSSKIWNLITSNLRKVDPIEWQDARTITWIKATTTPAQGPNGSGCYSNDKYVVVWRDDRGAAGQDFLIKYKTIANPNPSCQYLVEGADFEIKNRNSPNSQSYSAQWFLALGDHYLVLDNGTGRGGRGLTIYNLDDRQKIYYEDIYRVEGFNDAEIRYWAISNKLATENNCPADIYKNVGSGLGVAITTLVDLNVVTLEKKEIGRSTCINLE